MQLRTETPPKGRIPKLFLTVPIATVAIALLSNVTAFACDLGTAAGFTVLGGAGVTCTNSTVYGEVGSLLTVSETPTCTIFGPIDEGNSAAISAWYDFVGVGGAYDQAAAQPCNVNLTGQELAGMTLTPDVYCFDSTADLSLGTLTLDGPADGIWIFQIKTSITTANANVAMINGGLPCNVFWETGMAATIGNGTDFQGTILAGSAITFTGDRSSLVGRAFAKTAVTMTGASIYGPTPYPDGFC